MVQIQSPANFTYCIYEVCLEETNIKKKEVGGSPGLVVMGVDSRSKGRGFESQRRILDGHFFTLICCKNCIVCLKRPKINKKEAGVGPIFKKKKKEAGLSHFNRSYLLLKSFRYSHDFTKQVVASQSVIVTQKPHVA